MKTFYRIMSAYLGLALATLAVACYKLLGDGSLLAYFLMAMMVVAAIDLIATAAGRPLIGPGPIAKAMMGED